ncbi:MAG: succinate dehydrogenase assembly factor 2 [Sphingobium sp.]|uniref:FAD assembly factor SdhE n=1 Tax=Sphingobium sp. TaxID=1912891 RepID=UPI0029BA9F16|nr:succinate dehydrogenase assembly factor 2 [Sphingobium sp.]MDX3908797.1 succinate dehydrogenase assembly factor 2 [Sphingobium sp.]
MHEDPRLRRLSFRASHRGTKEADLMIGGFFDTYGATWTEEQLLWFEELLEEQDVDIMAWALGTLPIPERYQGPMMDAMRKLDFVPIAK